MPRYIDMDKISKMIEARAEQLIEGKEALLYVEKWLNLLPEADVVPKSEVDKAIDDLKRYIILNEDISKKCKSENGEQNEEYWKGKLSAFLQIRGYLDAELKKKYIQN